MIRGVTKLFYPKKNLTWSPPASHFIHFLGYHLQDQSLFQKKKLTAVYIFFKKNQLYKQNKQYQPFHHLVLVGILVGSAIWINVTHKQNIWNKPKTLFWGGQTNRHTLNSNSIRLINCMMEWFISYIKYCKICWKLIHN